jgi:hypothetical protein
MELEQSVLHGNVTIELVDIPPHIIQLQMEEVRKRRSEVRSGKVQGIPSQQVRDEIASLLK